MIDKYPALIAQCTDNADVVSAIQFAKNNDLQVAIRGGGHHVAGYAVCDDNSDLFWALRGGGGNFGIVTNFKYRLHPVGPDVTTLNPIFPIGEARQALTKWRAFTAKAPEEATTAFAMWVVPTHSDFSKKLHGTNGCLFDGMHIGPPEDADADFHPLREIDGKLLDLSDRVSYVEAQRAFCAAPS